MQIQVNLKTDLFTTECKELIDEALKDSIIGTELYIKIDRSSKCPFPQDLVEDQIRATYGRHNRYIHFGTTFHAGSVHSLNERNPSQQLLRRFFNGEVLIEGEVPEEVFHWLEEYRRDNLPLIDYLTKTHQ